MQAIQTPLFKILDGRKQYLIPIYQRTYSWTTQQCKQLWEDLLKISENKKSSGHFIGSIVYIEGGLYQASDISQLQVIDGQQRLTTILLFLTALGDIIGERQVSSGLSKVKIQNSFLFNRDEAGDKHYKLVLTQSDKNTLMDILDGRELEETSSINLVTNYKFFKEQIEKSDIDLNSLYSGFLKLIVVDISLDIDHDDPQLIFESLNSTGLELSQADLIRNYILMGLEQKEQNDIYKNYWYKIEKYFEYGEKSEYFNRFMKDYLTIKMNSIPREKEVYSVFKKFFKIEDKEIKEHVSDIYYYSKFFTALAFGIIEDISVKQKIQDINSLPVDVAYPFLLQVYVDFDKEKISHIQFLEVLDLVESYVFRRQICEIPTNSLNKIFATLYKSIDPKNYVESLKAALIHQGNYRRFPNNGEFYEQFQVKNSYNFRSRNYLLRKLENFERKELVNVDEYTIEHIMPQNENLSQLWRDELGEKWKEIHEKFLHKIGNLTLTKYNSELNTYSFKEKQNMVGGFKDSPLRLNSDLTNIEQWGEIEIQNRSKILADKALKIWKYPEITVETLEKYNPEDEDEDDEFESSSRSAKLAWATRRFRNPQKYGPLSDEDRKLLDNKT